MKKIIPAGIAALGVVGLLGLGASAASAAPRVTIQGSACATISADQASLSVSMATANTTLTNDQASFSSAGEALSSASATFAADFNAYVVAVTNGDPTDGPLATLKDAQTALGTDLTAWASAESAVNTAQNVVNADNVASTLLSDLSSSLSC